VKNGNGYKTGVEHGIIDYMVKILLNIKVKITYIPIFKLIKLVLIEEDKLWRIIAEEVSKNQLSANKEVLPGWSKTKLQFRPTRAGMPAVLSGKIYLFVLRDAWYGRSVRIWVLSPQRLCIFRTGSNQGKGNKYFHTC